MSAPLHPPLRALLGWVALGLVALAAGVALAERFLPEWRAGEPPARALLAERFREAAARGGFALEPGEPQIALTTRGPEQFEPYRELGDAGTGWLLATRTAIRAAAVGGVRDPQGTSRRLAIDFSFAARPEYLIAWDPDAWSPFAPFDGEQAGRLADRLAPLLLAPGETLGPRRQAMMMSFPRLLYPVAPAAAAGARPQHLAAWMLQGAFIERRPGPLTDAAAGTTDAELMRTVVAFWRRAPLLVGLVGLFLVLLVRSRLSAVNGALLALAALPTLYPTAGSLNGPLYFQLGAAACATLEILLLWSCAESLLRSTDPTFTTSLDALRAGRLGPRGGRALLVGLACGGGLGGLRLALLALAAAVPGVWPSRSSVELPLVRSLGSPLSDGILLAGGVALAFALTVRVVPVRWAFAAAALVAGLCLRPVAVAPLPAAVAANALFCALLIWIGRRAGLTALLTAAVAALALPGAVLAARYLDAMPGGFAFTAGLCAALFALGITGMTRSGGAEIQRLAPPAFVRRLEEERRFKNEMDLLAKMQRGLLPRTLPAVGGWELAARSIIANEAGGDLYDLLADDDGYLWIAAGDVAGHGYSCAIALAMTKAAFASLAGRGRTPAEVLQRMDRVLRAAGPARSFTSLLLLRLRPESGEGTLSNAAHPYPWLLTPGGAGEAATAEEIEIAALPLGQGPPRKYVDREIRLPPGASLVLCSDGIFEGADEAGQAYGFERLRAVLGGAARLPAEKILEAVLDDWRRHLRRAKPLDDTTVLVLRRALPREAAP
jgi:serine phosphatase RsbU (regulator of sigma subunit)